MYVVFFFSGKPLGWMNVFTAFGVGLFGLIISLGLFLTELVTASFRGCRKLMNAYNYRIDVEEYKPHIGHGGVKSIKIEVQPKVVHRFKHVQLKHKIGRCVRCRKKMS